MKTIVKIAGLCLTVGITAASAALAADKPVLTLRTFAVSMGSPGDAGTATVDIVIERWSTDAERVRLKDALVETGSDKLLSALQDIKPRVGFIRADGGLGWDLRYAREEVSPTTGAHRIVIATDRPMAYWETVSRPRSADYEFTLAEIRIGKDGKGEGKLVPAAQVSWNKEAQMIEIENYQSQPVQLNAIRAEMKK